MYLRQQDGTRSYYYCLLYERERVHRLKTKVVITVLHTGPKKILDTLSKEISSSSAFVISY